MLATDDAIITELPALERGLEPDEVDARLAAIALAVEQTDYARAFYLHEVESRRLYLGFGHKSTAIFAEARHGLAPDLTWRLLRAAAICDKSPAIRAAFERGDIPLYKMDALREVVGLGEDEQWAARASDRGVSKQALRSAVKRRLGEEPDDEYVWIRVKVPPSLFTLYQDGLEKARRYAGAETGEPEALEAILVNWMNTVLDESEQDPELTALDPVIRRRGEQSEATSEPGAERTAETAEAQEPVGEGGESRVEQVEPPIVEQSSALTSWSSPTRLGDAPMSREERMALEKQLRAIALWKAGWRCEACGGRCDLHVDHIETRALHPRLIFDEANLCVLCLVCHALKTNGIIRVARLSDGTLRVTRPSRWNEPPPRAS